VFSAFDGPIAGAVAFDDAGAGAVSAFVARVVEDLRDDAAVGRRRYCCEGGKSAEPSASRRITRRDCMNDNRSGSMSASCAASTISALMA
jgi:hypothetical protein